jgi:hypothetical protein
MNPFPENLLDIGDRCSLGLMGSPRDANPGVLAPFSTPQLALKRLGLRVRERRRSRPRDHRGERGISRRIRSGLAGRQPRFFAV